MENNMNFVINLDKMDIRTFKCGDNVGIQVYPNFLITLTPRAVEELVKDVGKMELELGKPS
jgi:hypothetical protein